MTEGKRPGGLTALAVINFVLGGFALVVSLAWALSAGQAPEPRATGPESGQEAPSRSPGEEEGETPAGESQRTAEGTAEGGGTPDDVRLRDDFGDIPLALMITLQALSVVLLIVSGVGYLKQKKVLGRYIGNSYALVDLTSGVLFVAAVGDIPIQTLIGFVYPLLTLFLINVTFKDDLVN